MAYKEIPDVTLKMIINAGIIEIGTKVYSSPNNDIIGTIDRDGAITFEINNEIKTVGNIVLAIVRRNRKFNYLDVPKISL